MDEKEHSWPGRERRAHPRVKADLAAQIVTHEKRDQPVVVRARNISCSGLYCHLDKYIAPFQKLHLSIIVPLIERNRVHNEVIQLDAVTVRVEPEEEDPDVLDYHVAIFFENTSEKDRQIIDISARPDEELHLFLIQDPLSELKNLH